MKEGDDFYETTLEWLIGKGVLNRNLNVFVVCGGRCDKDVLLEAGFTDVTISNLDSRANGDEFSPFRWRCQDAEKLEIPDNEYDFCIVHNGLHHCASPHRALLEMFRVARKGVLVFEPRDTLLVRLGIRFNFGQDYETASVEGDGLGFGGMRNSGIPNYVYRWTEREIEKTIRSFSPWGEPRFLYRYALRIPWARLRAMRNKTFLFLVNMLLPLLRLFCFCFPKQSNGFAFAVIKPRIPDDVQPWLKLENGRILMNRDWMEREYTLQGNHIKTRG
jgi:SAM-dependent methyltransferase